MSFEPDDQVYGQGWEQGQEKLVNFEHRHWLGWQDERVIHDVSRGFALESLQGQSTEIVPEKSLLVDVVVDGCHLTLPASQVFCFRFKLGFFRLGITLEKWQFSRQRRWWRCMPSHRVPSPSSRTRLLMHNEWLRRQYPRAFRQGRASCPGIQVLALCGSRSLEYHKMFHFWIKLHYSCSRNLKNVAVFIHLEDISIINLLLTLLSCVQLDVSIIHLAWSMAIFWADDIFNTL